MVITDLFKFVILSNSFSYPAFSTPASNGFGSTKGGGKMMRERERERGSTKPSEEVILYPSQFCAVR